jgi:rod shape-determining protein MreD
MERIYARNIIRFVILVLIQVFILNYLELFGFINPCLYIYFILLLPFSTPGWLLLILSFFLGLSVDFFSGTTGLNAAATVLAGFLRPAALRITGYAPEITERTEPSVQVMGFMKFFFYSAILVVIHQATIFYLEIFRFSESLFILLKVLSGSALTLLLIMICEYIFRSQKTR